MAPASAAARPPASIRYQFMKLTAEGGFAPVSAPFAVNDSVRLQVTPGVSGTMTVSVRGESQALVVQRVQAGRTYAVPAAGYLPAAAGSRTLVVAVQRQASADLGPAGGSISGIRASRRKAESDSAGPVTIEIPVVFR